MQGSVELARLEAPDRRILFEWPTPVEWMCTPRGDDTTLVSISASGFGGSGDDRIARAIDMLGGTNLLAGCKAFLEHSVELNLVADHHPDAHVKQRA